jgi:hypothetical protein
MEPTPFVFPSASQALRVSFSSLSTSARCLREAYLTKIVGLVPVEEQKLVNLILGEAGHRAMARYLASRNPEEALEIFEETYRGSGLEIAESDTKGLPNTKLCLEAWFRTHPLEALPFEIRTPSEDIELSIEVPFLDRTFLVGVIDALAYDRFGEVVLVEHKFTSYLAEDRVRMWKMSSQIPLYSYLVAAAYGIQVTHAYINSVEWTKLPGLQEGSPKKCRLHATSYLECRLEHARSRIIQLEVTPQRIKTALEAIRPPLKALTDLYHQAKDLTFEEQLNRASSIPPVGMAHSACTWCNYALVCYYGCPPEALKQYFTKKDLPGNVDLQST